MDTDLFQPSDGVKGVKEVKEEEVNVTDIPDTGLRHRNQGRLSSSDATDVQSVSPIQVITDPSNTIEGKREDSIHESNNESDKDHTNLNNPINRIIPCGQVTGIPCGGKPNSEKLKALKAKISSVQPSSLTPAEILALIKEFLEGLYDCPITPNMLLSALVVFFGEVSPPVRQVIFEQINTSFQEFLQSLIYALSYSLIILTNIFAFILRALGVITNLDYTLLVILILVTVITGNYILRAFARSIVRDGFNNASTNIKAALDTVLPTAIFDSAVAYIIASINATIPCK